VTFSSALLYVKVTTQVSDSSPPAAARVFFAAGIAAAGGNARSKKNLANHRRW